MIVALSYLAEVCLYQLLPVWSYLTSTRHMYLVSAHKRLVSFFIQNRQGVNLVRFGFPNAGIITKLSPAVLNNPSGSVSSMPLTDWAYRFFFERRS